MELDDLLGQVDDYIFVLIKRQLIAYALKALALSGTGFISIVVIKLVGLFVDKLLIPVLKDLKEEGFLFLRKQELKRKLKAYMEAQTDEEFNDSFDDLISGSSL